MADRVLEYAAFTDGGAGGNPAGVVLDATGWSDAEMLATAARLGHSETAFLLPTAVADEFAIRYFSPLAEVAFCGHATVATAVALAERRGAGSVRLRTRSGSISVRTTAGPDGLVATLTSVPTRTRPATGDELDRALAALGWQHDELDPRFPPHVAYAGNDHLVLAAATRARLADLAYDVDALAALMAERVWVTVQLVWCESVDVFHVRDPFPPGGVVEDPATGAAALALGGYLRDLRLVPVPSRITLLQGQDMGRPSRLLVDVAAGVATVDVSGAAGPLS